MACNWAARFFAESMFHGETERVESRSCIFLVTRLRERGFALLECQWLTRRI